MIHIQSPFVKEIPTCKLIMRRLRKKISKYSSTHKQVKKPRDQSNDILNLLKNRSIPAFVLDAIKKRRTFDMLSLKSVVLSGESNLDQMINLTNSQEKEIQGLFTQHKVRMRKPHHSRVNPKMQRKSTNCSSSEQQQISQDSHEMSFLSDSDGLTKNRTQSKDMYTGNHQISEHNNFQQDIPGFNGKDFLLFQGEIYSEEQWMRF